MIVGFDSDDDAVFGRQYEFLANGRIVGAMAGMLSAIPKTPLYARLEAEGRLDNEAADDPRDRHQRRSAPDEPRDTCATAGST